MKYRATNATKLGLTCSIVLDITSKEKVFFYSGKTFFPFKMAFFSNLAVAKKYIISVMGKNTDMADKFW